MTESPTTSFNDQDTSLLCQEDENSQDPLPTFCKQILVTYMDTLDENQQNNSAPEVYNEIIETNPFVTLLINFGLFLGVLVVLALLTFFICVRKKKEVEVTSTQEGPKYNQLFISGH